MAENVLTLKKKAVKLGMSKKDAMKATRPELEKFIASGNKKKAPVAVAKKKKVGGSKTKTTKKATTKTTSKKSTTKKSAPKRSSKNDAGRFLIGSLNFSKTDGWNPRDGSPVAIIFKALKKFRGDVDKATDSLMGQASKLTGTRKRDGSRRTKAEMRAALRYRVNRTKWEFATRTGQHDASDNRVEYGKGDYAQSTKKAKRKTTTKPKATTTKGKKTAKRKKATRR